MSDNQETKNDEIKIIQPTQEEIKEAKKDGSKRVVEASDGTHILERMRG